MKTLGLCLAFVMAAGIGGVAAPQIARASAPTGVPVIDFEALKPLLPIVAGWAQTGATGEQLSSPVSHSRAEARYRRSDERIELEIVDTATSPLLLAPFTMFVAPGFSERSEDSFKRAVRIGGHPGAEEWNAKTGRGEVTAIVSNRFLVHATGYHVGALDAVRTLVESVDFARLVALR